MKPTYFTFIIITILTVCVNLSFGNYDDMLRMIKMRDYEDAAEHLKKISPNDTLLGRLYILSGRYEDALSCDLSAYQRGWIYQKLERYEEAILSYSNVKGILYTDAMYKCGLCASEIEDTRLAIIYYEKAGNYRDSRHRLATSYEAEQKYIEALSIWNELDGSEFLLHKAEIYNLIQENGDSIYYELLKNFPASSHALAALDKVSVPEKIMADVLYKNKKYSEAIKYIPLNEHKLRALCFESLGKFTDATDEYKSIGDNLNAGKCLEKAGEYSKALEEYLLSNCDEGFFNAGFLYEKMGITRDAINAYDRVVLSFKKLANLRKGLLLLHYGEIDLAKVSFNNTFDVSGNYWLAEITAQPSYKYFVLNNAPLSYYSYLLDGTVEITNISPEEWIAQFCDTNYILSPDNSIRLKKGKLLLNYGLIDEAKRELTNIGEKNSLFRYRLALIAHEGGIDELAYWWASRLIEKRGSPYPKKLMCLAYPLYHLPKVLKYEEEYPFLFMALIKAESHFYPKAVSPSNAIGLTQVLPSTGKGIARELGIAPFDPESLKEPEVSIRFGLNYFNYCLQRFNGIPEYALSAYNGGPSRTSKWISDIPIDQWVERIPRTQTRLYVKKVMASYYVYKQLYKDLILEELKYHQNS